MTRLRIVHSTGFGYAEEATASYNEVRMTPQNTEHQLVLASHLTVSPTAIQHSYVDYWGTLVNAVEVLTPHRELTVNSTSLVEVGTGASVARPLGWEELAAERLRTTTVFEQSTLAPRTMPPADLQQLAGDVASSGLEPGAAALALCESIGGAMEYVQGVTGVHSTANEAWAERRGVCQDIAHVAIGALRSIGIPARYVSGYLHPRPDAAIGESVVGESHAWVEWFSGDWHGYDPTNLIEVGQRHVSVARGRDYGDVSPLRGVYAGPSASELFVSVKITRES